MRFLLVTYDSCRYDVLQAANTPVLDRYAPILPAQAPGNFTYPSHQAFFVGILPNAVENIPYYNRFCKQLVGLLEVGEGQVTKSAWRKVRSDWNLVQGLRDEGVQTVGTAAMNWFRMGALTSGFEHFLFTGRDADRQVAYLLDTIDPTRPFFAFVNFGETHAPFTFRGKTDACPDDVRARRIVWPPVERGPTGRLTPAFEHQVRAAEFLDVRLGRLFEGLPEDTVVVVTADHGECFGEDGYWGHGFNHPKVLEVTLSIFRLDGKPLDTDDVPTVFPMPGAMSEESA